MHIYIAPYTEFPKIGLEIHYLLLESSDHDHKHHGALQWHAHAICACIYIAITDFISSCSNAIHLNSLETIVENINEFAKPPLIIDKKGRVLHAAELSNTRNETDVNHRVIDQGHATPIVVVSVAAAWQ